MRHCPFDDVVKGNGCTFAFGLAMRNFTAPTTRHTVFSYFTIYQYTKYAQLEYAGNRRYAAAATNAFIRGEDYHVGIEIYVRESPTYAWVAETYVDVYQHVYVDATPPKEYYIRRRSHLETHVLHEIV
jgi:hypothetical protein